MKVLNSEDLKNMSDMNFISKYYKYDYNVPIINTNYDIYSTVDIDRSNNKNNINIFFDHISEYKFNSIKSINIDLLELKQEDIDLNMKFIYGRPNIIKFINNKIIAYEPYGIINENNIIEINYWKKKEQDFNNLDYIRFPDYLYFMKQYYKNKTEKNKLLEYIFKNKEEKIIKKQYEVCFSKSPDYNIQFIYEDLLNEKYYTMDQLFEIFSYKGAIKIINYMLDSNIANTPLCLNYYFLYILMKKDINIKEYIKNNNLNIYDIKAIDNILKSFYFITNYKNNLDLSNNTVDVVDNGYKIINDFAQFKYKEELTQFINSDKIDTIDIIEILSNNIKTDNNNILNNYRIGNSTYNIINILYISFKNNMIISYNDIIIEEMIIYKNIKENKKANHIYNDNNIYNIGFIQKTNLLKSLRELNINISFINEDFLNTFIINDKEFINNEIFYEKYNHVYDTDKLLNEYINMLYRHYKKIIEHDSISDIKNILLRMIDILDNKEFYKLILFLKSIFETIVNIQKEYDIQYPIYLKYVYEYLNDTLELFLLFRNLNSNITLYNLLSNIFLKTGLVNYSTKNIFNNDQTLTLETNIHLFTLLQNNTKVLNTIKIKTKKLYNLQISIFDLDIDFISHKLKNHLNLKNIKMEDIYIKINSL